MAPAAAVQHQRIINQADPNKKYCIAEGYAPALSFTKNYIVELHTDEAAEMGNETIVFYRHSPDCDEGQLFHFFGLALIASEP